MRHTAYLVSPDTASTMFIHQESCTPVACLVVLFLDTVSTWRVEYRAVWRQRKGLISAIYLWARYGALAALVVHNILAQIVLPRSTPPTIRQCSIWFSVVVVVCGSLSIGLEAILTLRVYALYGKTKKIWILVVPAGIQYGCCALFVYFRVLKLGAVPGFDSTCGLRTNVMEGMMPGFTTLIFHGLLYGATLAKRRVRASPTSPINRLIIQWVTREGTMAFALMIFIVTFVGPSMSVSRTIRLEFVFILPITFISLTTSRLILNMKTLTFECGSYCTVSEEFSPVSTIIQSLNASIEDLQ
ncbi:hypothetical protein CPB83DRAFT_385124 [Crepidotus variabilis]|uniref:DUF6533 domain-containing protein n=1 Tax=Crepidotus variabilis TaxID=179855 RepID=A0A9P6EDW8_9AGAR|nr:hypothetical protein CPB83DRAFT_385124 [Crepidotus variabilis]